MMSNNDKTERPVFCCKDKPECLWHDDWRKTVDPDYCKGLIVCQKPDKSGCQYHILFGYGLHICDCPFAALALKMKKKGRELFYEGIGNMEEVKAALILSSDATVRSFFSGMIRKTGHSYMLESEEAAALIRVLEYPFRFIVVDSESTTSELTDFLKVLKRLRPRLPVIAVLDESMEDNQAEIIQEGAMYCFLKDHEKIRLSVRAEQVLSRV